MKTKPLKFLLALTFLFLFSGSSAVFADDLQDAVAAYLREDYKIAHKLFLPFAKKGNSKAQHKLGQMYQNGQGVPQDYKEAVRWYRLSAEQGNINAKYYLGVMYGNGRGIPQDKKEAVKWLLKSAEQKNLERPSP